MQRLLIRFFDFLFSLFGIVILLPVFIIIAFAIVVNSSGGIFYKQKRVGQNNQEFVVYKFRTMYEGSHELREKVMADTDKDPRLAKNPQDPRVTKPGLFLRRWSIDEIPQLINVLKGEMSLVGPRPPLAEEVNKYEKSENRRLLVKPGLTGLWQVSGRKEVTWTDRMAQDISYIENWTFAFDLMLVLRTIKSIVTGKGAF